MTDRPHHPTERERADVRLLSGCGVTQDVIARRIGRSKGWLQKWCRKEMDDGIAEMHAGVAKRIAQAALNGNMTAAIFYAKTKMGWRETDRHEHTGEGGGPIQHEHADKQKVAAFIAKLEALAARQNPDGKTLVEIIEDVPTKP